MELNEELNMMRDWYSKPYVLYEMQYTHFFDREVCFMKPKHRRDKKSQTMFRYFSVCKPSWFNYMLNEDIDHQGNKMSLNVYATISKYNKILQLGKSVGYRNVEGKRWNDNERYKDMIEYDLFIDVDAPSRDLVRAAKQDTMKITKFLDELKMPYYLRFSGMGYHVIVPHKYFKHLGRHFNPHEIKGSVYVLFNEVLKSLHVFFTEFIDLGIHDSPRVSKTPYSLTFYPDGTYVCWPFKTKKEFYLHDPEDYRVNKNLMFKGIQKIYRRGQELFNKEEWKEECTDEFFKRLKIDTSRI